MPVRQQSYSDYISGRQPEGSTHRDRSVRAVVIHRWVPWRQSFKGPNRPGMPPFVALANSMVADVYGAGDLGQQYEPLDGMRVDGKFSMPKGVEVPRLAGS
jgi:hypothetical protein